MRLPFFGKKADDQKGREAEVAKATQEKEATTQDVRGKVKSVTLQAEKKRERPSSSEAERILKEAIEMIREYAENKVPSIRTYQEGDELKKSMKEKVKKAKEELVKEFGRLREVNGTTPSLANSALFDIEAEEEEFNKSREERINEIYGLIDEFTAEIKEKMYWLHGVDLAYVDYDDVFEVSMPLESQSTLPENVLIEIELKNGKKECFEFKPGFKIPGKFIRNASSLSVKYNLAQFLKD